jgi:glycine hydroxymethyltransferase
MHVIAAKAVAFREALSPVFKTYAAQIIKNAQALADVFVANEFKLVTGGTDNHLILVDLSDKAISGKDAEESLERAGITVNKNTVPGEKRSPFVTSGIRVGTPALTTRGFKETDMSIIAEWMIKVLNNPTDSKSSSEIRGAIHDMCKKFPIYN